MADKYASNLTIDKNTVDISARRVKNKGSERLQIIAGAGEDHTVTGSQVENVTGNKSVTAASVSEEITGDKTVEAESIFLAPTKPLRYGTPVNFNDYFKTVPMTSAAGDQYNLLVQTDLTKDIGGRRSVILIGDSYVAGVGGNGNDIETELKQLTNWSVTSFSAQGAGYIRVNASGKKAIDVVNDAIANTDNKSSITDVVLAFSVYNDTGSKDQSDFNKEGFYTQIKAIHDAVKANFTNARLSIIPSLWVNRPFNNVYRDVKVYTTFAAMSVGANYVSNSLWWLYFYNSSYISSDNVHPNSAGYKVLAEKIASVINGCRPCVYTGRYTMQISDGSNTANIQFFDDYFTITGMVKKTSGLSWQSIFSLPDELKNKYANTSFTAQAYGTNEIINCMLTGDGTYAPSDWFTQDRIYLFRFMISYDA